MFLLSNIIQFTSTQTHCCSWGCKAACIRIQLLVLEVLTDFVLEKALIFF